MDDQTRQRMARALLGQGVVGQTADIQKLQPIFQQQSIQAQMNGQPMPPFEVWAQQYQQTQQGQ